MADSTISFRATDETRTRLETLAKELGSSQKELLERLVDTFETTISQESEDIIPELAPLQQHVRRIEEIYIAMVRDYKDKQQESGEEISKLREEVKDLKAQLLETKELAETEVNKAQEQLKIAIGEAAQVKEQAEKELAEMRKKVVDAEKERKQYAQMVEIAQDRAAYAQEKAASFEEKANLADQYKHENNSLQAELSEAKNSSHALQAKVEQLEKQLAEQEQHYIATLNAKEEEKLREIESVRREERADCKDQVLDLKDKSMAETERIRKEYEDRIQRLLDRLEKEQLPSSLAFSEE
ncbi:hypothetical protein V6C27_14230 [Peptococcaceae bacterium 1198_IL3148]